MNAHELLKNAGLAVPVGLVDVAVNAIADDSRQVTEGGLFLATAGLTQHGLDYLDAVVALKPAAILWEPNERYATAPEQLAGIPNAAIAKLSDKLGVLAAAFFQQPSQRLRLLAVTGTNGKTSCVSLYQQAAAACAQLGTLGYGFADKLHAATHTTPGPVRVQALLAEFVENGAREAIMEVSSHALDQGRVNGATFDTAIFTNLTQDHLDYHGDMASYGAAKAKLFEWPELRWAIINADDAYSNALIERVAASAEVILFSRQLSIEALANNASHYLCCTALEINETGLQLSVANRINGVESTAELNSPLLGEFNAANLLAVLAALLAGGMPLGDACERLAKAQPVAGRMQRLPVSGQLPNVVVDYAHTPDALEKALLAVREHCQGELLCVFGCGGDRDQSKRPLMGAAAEKLADQTYVTSDNPRSESPQQIVDDIVAGMQRAANVIELDRAKAISAAIRQANANDWVLVAGKGHEQYQEIAGRKTPFSDVAVATAALEAKAA